MITEKDLQEAIAECEGQRNPNANTCIKLAAFYTIKQHMFGGVSEESYSYASGPEEPEDEYESDTEFFSLIRDKSRYEVLELADEIVATLKVVNPRMYNSIIRRLS